MILGHRLSELCGHGPSLETDIALTNISLDLFGQTRNYFQYAASLDVGEKSEDEIAFLRMPNEYLNCLLTEQPNTNFAHVIVRQFFFDQYHQQLLQELRNSNDTSIAAIAEKSLKEVKYHAGFSEQWVKRLGDGTDESQTKMQQAVDSLYPYLGELTNATSTEEELFSFGIGANLNAMEEGLHAKINAVLKEATLQIPEETYWQSGGKEGIHSEHMGYILAELQFMQRTYPNMTW